MDDFKHKSENERLTADVLKEKIASFLMLRDTNGVIGYEVMYGSSRRVADMVFISKGHSYAIEIKSEFDTIARLEGQLKEYRLLFDYILVFSAPNHLDTIKTIISDIVGLYCIRKDGIQNVQHEKINHQVQKSEMLISIPSATIKVNFSIKGKLTSDEIRAAVIHKPYKVIHDYFIHYYKMKLGIGETYLEKKMPRHDEISEDYIIV